eukprot:11161800-Lingulodinium_polyedra.AAC.1
MRATNTDKRAHRWNRYSHEPDLEPKCSNLQPAEPNRNHDASGAPQPCPIFQRRHARVRAIAAPRYQPDRGTENFED